MAWASAHFATGMACGGAVGLLICAARGKGWRAVPLAMTLGGFWAMVPDMPRLFRVDFPSLGLADSLGSIQLERWLHAMGDLFFFHRALDAQPREFALHGLLGIILFYNASLFFTLHPRKRIQFDLRMVGEFSDAPPLNRPSSPNPHATSHAPPPPPLRLTEYQKTPGP